MRPYGIQSKIIRVFVTQAVFISLATFFGVYASTKIVERVLVKQALQEEAEHFWQLQENNPAAGLPDTRNLTGYLAATGDWSQIPADLQPALRKLNSDFERIAINGNEPIVYRSSNKNYDLFLFFNEEQVSRLSFFFGTVPLSVVLIVIYLGAWLAYRQSRHAISPVIKLAERVGSFDIQENNLPALDLSQVRNKADADVMVLVEAVEGFTNRLVEFVERERHFTQDASHELRTPLAVIKGSLDILENNMGDLQKQQPVILRIRKTVRDMEALLETLLLLARETELGMPDTSIILNDLLRQILELIKTANMGNDIPVELQESCLLNLNAPEKVLTILFSNLIRNALNYTQSGKIVISVTKAGVSIQDSGSGMSEEEMNRVFEPFYRASSGAGSKGHGLGLAIVKRLCDRFGWHIEIESEPQKGTVVVLRFPQAQQLAATT